MRLQFLKSNKILIGKNKWVKKHLQKKSVNVYNIYLSRMLIKIVKHFIFSFQVNYIYDKIQTFVNTIYY